MKEEDWRPFVEKVARMRELQKRFFKHSDYKILEECKSLEREVDQRCEDALNPQPRLFE